MRVGFDGLGRRDWFVGLFGDEESLKVKVRVVGIWRNLEEEDMVRGITSIHRNKQSS